jgi:hypothetical protein
VDGPWMRKGLRAIAVPSRQVRRKFENPKLPSGAQTAQGWDEYQSQLADLDMERLRQTGIPASQEQFIKKAAKAFRNSKRQAYKW